MIIEDRVDSKLLLMMLYLGPLIGSVITSTSRNNPVSRPTPIDYEDDLCCAYIHRNTKVSRHLGDRTLPRRTSA